MKNKIFPLFFSILAAINFSGCAIGAAGLYESGKAVRDFNAPYEKTIEAAKSAFSGLGLTLKEADIGKKSAKLKGKYADGKHVIVVIENINESSSRVEVQVGSVISPDKNNAANILDAISRQLGL